MDAVRKETPIDDGYLTVPQAGRAIGRSATTVPALILRGELRGRVIAGRTFVEKDSVEEYKARAAAEGT